MGYNYLELEGDGGFALHTGEDEEEEEYLKALEKLRKEVELEEKATQERIEQLKEEARKKICSCGYYTCAMVSRYGTRKPVFDGEIEPISSQYMRDEKALRLIAEGCNDRED